MCRALTRWRSVMSDDMIELKRAKEQLDEASVELAQELQRRKHAHVQGMTALSMRRFHINWCKRELRTAWRAWHRNVQAYATKLKERQNSAESLLLSLDRKLQWEKLRFFKHWVHVVAQVSFCPPCIFLISRLTTVPL